MKLYAIKDRMLNYYMTPFASQDDNAVLASISETVNLDGQHAIQQAPQHFEIWQIGEVDEDGHITPRKEFLTTCDTLIRPRRSTAEPGKRQAQPDADPSDNPLKSNAGAPRAENGSIPDPTQATSGQTPQARREYQGSPSRSSD